MVKLVFASAVFSMFLCSAETGREVIYKGEISPLNITPTFDNGFLVAYGARVTVVYSPDGAPVLSLNTPENVTVWNVAVDTDGAVARAVEYHASSTGGILISDRSGAPINSIRHGRVRSSTGVFRA